MNMHQGQVPSIGRIVHFFPCGVDAPRAAIITGVFEQGTKVDLFVMSGRGGQPCHVEDVAWGLPQDTKVSRWHWPPRTT